MKTAEILKKCREIKGLKTNYQLSKETGISEARLSDYEKGKRIPDNFAIYVIAEILGKDESQLLAEFEFENEKNPVKKAYWGEKLKQMGSALAIIILSVNLILTPTPAEAAPVLKQNARTLYIMLTRLRRWIASNLIEPVSRNCQMLPVHAGYLG